MVKCCELVLYAENNKSMMHITFTELNMCSKELPWKKDTVKRQVKGNFQKPNYHMMQLLRKKFHVNSISVKVIACVFGKDSK
jgi:hypothetical protein